MQPLNIFVLHPSDMLTDHLPHGAGWIVYNYLRGLAERGHNIHVAVPQLELQGPVPARMHVYPIPRRPGYGATARLSYMLAVRRLLARLSESVRFDIAQQFTPVDTGLSLGVLGTGVPLVLGPYSGHWSPDAFGVPRPPNLSSRIKRRVRDAIASFQQHQASALIVTCPAAVERIVSSKARDARVHVVSHGIHCDAHVQRDDLPARQSILFLANLEYWKGIFTLLDAFDRVASVLPDCSLEIWGSGEAAEGVARRIGQSAFKDRIHCRGKAPRAEVGELMRSHSVYCMPSHGEPFGITLLEAMAAGVPIVTTDAGGPPYIVREPGGRTVPMRNAGALADALVEILSNEKLQRSMGAYNRSRVEREFDWSKSLDRMESVYLQVLNGGDELPTRLAANTRWRCN